MTRKGKPPVNKASELTETQQAFIKAYLGEAHYCAAKAARIIGSKSNYAAWQLGYRMMKNPAVRAVIDECLKQQHEEFERRWQLQQQSIKRPRWLA